MLAMDRLSCEFSSYRIWPLTGLKMIAAAARTSGTTAPVESVLNRGVIASRRPRIRLSSRARATARAFASRTRRVFAARAEYAAFFLTVVMVRRGVGLRVAASAVAGRQIATPSNRDASRATRTGRIRRKNPPTTAKRLAGSNRWYYLWDISEFNNK